MSALPCQFCDAKIYKIYKNSYYSLVLTVHSTKFLRFLSLGHFVNALSIANGIVTRSLLTPSCK